MLTGDDIKTKYLNKSFDELIDELILLEQIIKSLKFENFSLKELVYARRSEKFKADPEGMKPLFNEVEAVYDCKEIDQEEINSEGNSNKKNSPNDRKRGKRKPLSD